MTIKGVDYYLASLLSSYIGDITRFESKDRLASFFGVLRAIICRRRKKHSGADYRKNAS
ncbi:MAG: transposase [Thermoplasmata archaeon]